MVCERCRVDDGRAGEERWRPWRHSMSDSIHRRSQHMWGGVGGKDDKELSGMWCREKKKRRKRSERKLVE